MVPAWMADTVTPDLDRALHYTLLWGLESVVLRTVGARGDRVPHVNETKLKRRLAEHEVAVAAVDPGLFEGAAEARNAWLNDLTLLAEVAAFCTRIGCGCILVGGVPGEDVLAAEALQRAGDVAARHGLVMAVKNETGGRATGRSVADVLDRVAHPSVQAAWHPADALEAGEDPSDGLDALGDHVALVSVRDGVPEPSGWEPRPLGAGAVGWEIILLRLDEQGYNGPVSLDLRDLAAAKDGLGEASALIRLLRSARRA